MTQFYGMRRLNKADDWKGIAGMDNWVASHSAFELAYAWHDAGGFPPDVEDAFQRSYQAVFRGLVLETAIVEKPVFLDTLIGPSMNDLMGYARNAEGDRVIVTVEGKARETFGLPVASWVRGDRLVPSETDRIRPSRVRRLKFLSQELGIDVDSDSSLRYQLLHRTTSVLLEGALYGAAATLVVIHSFADAGFDAENWNDYNAFLATLGVTSTAKGEVTTPVLCLKHAKMPLFFLWVSSRPRVAAT